MDIGEHLLELVHIDWIYYEKALMPGNK